MSDREVGELEDQLKRALADLDNLRKRFDREVARERAAAAARIAAGWLPVLDDLERAIEHAEGDANSIIDGVRVVRDEAASTLAAQGFPRFDDVGALFDPSRHDAIATIESSAPPGTVVTTVRPGYGSGDAILRPAAVVVSKAQSNGSGRDEPD